MTVKRHCQLATLLLTDYVIQIKYAINSVVLQPSLKCTQKCIKLCLSQTNVS